MNESTELAASGEQEASPAVITPFQLEVQNLVVGAISREILRLGDSASLAKFAETERDRVRLIVWNEGGLSLVMGDRTSEVLFVPEIYPETEMFFSREHKRDKQGYGGSSGNRVWEGEYEPVLFAKKDLVKFLARHSGGDKGLLDSVKTLRVTQRFCCFSRDRMGRVLAVSIRGTRRRGKWSPDSRDGLSGRSWCRPKPFLAPPCNRLNHTFDMGAWALGCMSS